MQFATRNCVHEGTCKQNNCNRNKDVNTFPCFWLLDVVEIKMFHYLFIRLFTETDSTIEDFHYRTM